MSTDTWKPSTVIPDVLVCDVAVGSDARGSGRRVTDAGGLRAAGADLRPTDAFILTSSRDVLRGMHAQSRGGKTVTCLEGVVLDVVLDLRPESPTYGRHEAFELRGDSARNLYLPAGVAHAFLTLTDVSRVLIQTDASGGPDAGVGVRWDSFGYDWPCGAPVVSARDAAFPAFRPSGDR